MATNYDTASAVFAGMDEGQTGFLPLGVVRRALKRLAAPTRSRADAVELGKQLSLLKQQDGTVPYTEVLRYVFRGQPQAAQERRADREQMWDINERLLACVYERVDFPAGSRKCSEQARLTFESAPSNVAAEELVSTREFVDALRLLAFGLTLRQAEELAGALRRAAGARVSGNPAGAGDRAGAAGASMVNYGLFVKMLVVLEHKVDLEVRAGERASGRAGERARGGARGGGACGGIRGGQSRAAARGRAERKRRALRECVRDRGGAMKGEARTVEDRAHRVYLNRTAAG